MVTPAQPRLVSLAVPPSGGSSFPHIPCTWGSLLWGPTLPETHGEDRQRPWLGFLTSPSCHHPRVMSTPLTP